MLRDKSRQCDVLIYDRSLYAPLLEVNNLVVLPIDVVQFVIEVKVELNKKRLKEALENVATVGKLSLEFLGYHKPRMYIFAFDSPKLETVAGYEMLANAQENIGVHIEGICVLNKGFLYPGTSKEGIFEIYSRDNALFVFIYLILKEIYFRTGIVGAKRNPYDAYIDAVQEITIK